MAFNIQTFKTRSLTAVIFVLVMMSCILLHGWAFAALFLFIMMGCLYEFARINKLIYASAYVYQLIWAIPYIILPLLMMIDLGFDGQLFREGPGGLQPGGYSPLMPCAIIFSIWINDTMAYIVGSLIGRTPFSPISPKKTWEGTIGGAILCIVVISILGALLPVAQSVPWKQWLVIAAICAVFGTLGDLLESKLKRMAGIKDSGSIMPGHGGFLDRFDSLLLATPIVWIYVKLAW